MKKKGNLTFTGVRINLSLIEGNGSFRPRVVSALSRFGRGSFRPESFRQVNSVFNIPTVQKKCRDFNTPSSIVSVI